MRRLMKGLLVVLVALPVTAMALTDVINAKVTRTLASDDVRFGGCMAWLSVSPSDKGLDCPSGNWVTFSCTGDHVSKSSALRMYDSAQMAFLTDRTVKVTVDDSRKHNGYCLVERIDVMGE